MVVGIGSNPLWAWTVGQRGLGDSGEGLWASWAVECPAEDRCWEKVVGRMTVPPSKATTPGCNQGREETSR